MSKKIRYIVKLVVAAAGSVVITGIVCSVIARVVVVVRLVSIRFAKKLNKNDFEHLKQLDRTITVQNTFLIYNLIF